MVRITFGWSLYAVVRTLNPFCDVYFQPSPGPISVKSGFLFKVLQSF